MTYAYFKDPDTKTYYRLAINNSLRVPHFLDIAVDEIRSIDDELIREYTASTNPPLTLNTPH